MNQGCVFFFFLGLRVNSWLTYLFQTSFVISDIVSQTDNRPVFSGALYIDDVYITRSTGSGKKQLKHTVYDVALQLLKTWSVEDIMAQNDPGESMGLQAEQTEVFMFVD